jgi:hypothetical protein
MLSTDQRFVPDLAARGDRVAPSAEREPALMPSAPLDCWTTCLSRSRRDSVRWFGDSVEIVHFTQKTSES